MATSTIREGKMTPTSAGTSGMKMELDPTTLARRQKQINYGKVTESYRNYLMQTPKEKRGPTMPTTPELHRKCSRRCFDGQIRVWRIRLHQYDVKKTSETVHSRVDAGPQREEEFWRDVTLEEMDGLPNPRTSMNEAFDFQNMYSALPDIENNWSNNKNQTKGGGNSSRNDHDYAHPRYCH